MAGGRLTGIVLAIAGLGSLCCASAQPANVADSAIDAQILTRDFLQAHPDIKYRVKGMEAYDSERRQAAFQYFKRSAFYADKPSQGMLAEMLWNGEGVASDHALAYVWMDLAAERGFPVFVKQRERYWSLLDGRERARAVSTGSAIRSVYADAAAEPRISAKLRSGLANVTGSHLGSTVGSALTITVPGPGGRGRSIDGAEYFAPKYWKPAKYRDWRDEAWSERRHPTVSVGALQIVTDDPAIKSRLPDVAPDTTAEEPEVPNEPL